MHTLDLICAECGSNSITTTKYTNTLSGDKLCKCDSCGSILRINADTKRTSLIVKGIKRRKHSKMNGFIVTIALIFYLIHTILEFIINHVTLIVILMIIITVIDILTMPK